MKKFFIHFSVVILLAIWSMTPLKVKADEGMWLPFLVERLNHTDMQKMGLKLSSEELFSINNSSLKDAIILFGRGCTGEIISPEGLILTNHHCGYGAIQSVSTVANDYLSEGFWAASLAEEIPIKGLSVQFLISVEPATAVMLEGIRNDMTESQRDEILEKNRKKIIESATKGTTYNAVVKDFFNGNEFYTFVYETYNDIRLVGAPPSSIGKYGADTDNWMWPRHTGDFSIFRVYVGADNKAATYSKENVPLKPKHYLPINAGGVENGDFAMIMGFPGRTDRYLTSHGVQLGIDKVNPAIVDIRRKKLDIMGEDMAASADIRIKYASKYAGIANYWKYFIGQTKGLKRLKVADKKKEQEDQFTAWAYKNPETKSMYGNVMNSFKDAYQKTGDISLTQTYLREAAFGAEIIGFASRADELKNALSEKDAGKLDASKTRLIGYADDFYKNYNAATDQKILAAMLEKYYANVAAEFHPSILVKMARKEKGDFVEIAEDVFESSIFSSKETFDKFMEKPSKKAIEKDPAYRLAMGFREMMRHLSKESDAANDELRRARRLYLAGLKEMQPERKFYPDANQTMRLTYGRVQDYKGADAVQYKYFTTYQGILEKEDPTNWEFVVPAKLKKLFLNKDFGPYAKDGNLHVCFLTTHDITGGNSGSPVINGKGELIGLAFDGNWEAMSGDIAYETELQRTINVDIRYVLFIIDKFADCQHIMKELEIKGL